MIAVFLASMSLMTPYQDVCSEQGSRQRHNRMLVCILQQTPQRRRARTNDRLSQVEGSPYQKQRVKVITYKA